MKKVHPSVGSMPKGKSRSGMEGAKCDHPSLGAEVGNQSAPNNPNAHASGKPHPGYSGGPGKLQINAPKKNYAEQPKHLKQ